MNKLVLSSVLGAALLISWESQAGPAPPAPASTATPKLSFGAKRMQSAVSGRSVIMCYTCGGSYPNYVVSPNLGGYNYVWEYSAGCGTLGWVWDNSPYMCSN